MFCSREFELFGRRISNGLIAAVAITSAPALGQGICGSWIHVPSPAAENDSLLHGVDGLSPNNAWAVGYANRRGIGHDVFSLTMHWDGAEWTHVPSPSPGVYSGGGIEVRLKEVRALAADDVWAVGSYLAVHPLDHYVGFQSFAMHWNGNEWTQVPTPITPVGGTGADLDDVEFLSPDQGWAAGFRVDPASDRLAVGLVLHWDGTEWTEMPPLPIPGRDFNMLRGIEVFAPDDIMVVGVQDDGGHAPNKAWILRWDGSTWNEQDLPFVAQQTHPFDIASTSPDNVWVVGYYHADADQQILPLILHFDGSTWTHHDAEVDHLLHADLRAISIVAPDDIWASGLFAASDDDPYVRPLLMHYDGTAWTQVETAPEGAIYGQLWDVVAIDGCEAWAVGQSNNHGHSEIQRLHGDSGGPDFALQQTELHRGQPATFTATGAQPGERVYYLYSFAGTGSGPCLPQLGGLCIDLMNPVTNFGSAVADAGGEAVLVMTVPAGAPLRTVHTQAVIRRGAGGAESIKSNINSDSILP